MIRWEAKRPTERRDYRHDWTPFLGEDTIASETHTATGVDIDSVAIETGDRSVLFWVSGGTDGTARITQTIVTAGGRSESETFALSIRAIDEPISLAEAKAYLRVSSDFEDAKIEAMIPRARLWVEDYTSLALVRRSFTERHVPKYGAVRLFKSPLVSVESIEYGDAQTYVPRFWEPDPILFAALDTAWPTLTGDDRFVVTYTAGYAEGEVDDRLLGAMYALIQGEYDEGRAYPPSAVEAAERCCGQVRKMAL